MHHSTSKRLVIVNMSNTERSTNPSSVYLDSCAFPWDSTTINLILIPLYILSIAQYSEERKALVLPLTSTSTGKYFCLKISILCSWIRNCVRSCQLGFRLMLWIMEMNSEKCHSKRSGIIHCVLQFAGVEYVWRWCARGGKIWNWLISRYFLLRWGENTYLEHWISNVLERRLQKWKKKTMRERCKNFILAHNLQWMLLIASMNY